MITLNALFSRMNRKWQWLGGSLAGLEQDLRYGTERLGLLWASSMRLNSGVQDELSMVQLGARRVTIGPGARLGGFLPLNPRLIRAMKNPSLWG